MQLRSQFNLVALKESASNHFYTRQGFQFIKSTESDDYYVRESVPAIGPACQVDLMHLDARFDSP